MSRSVAPLILLFAAIGLGTACSSKPKVLADAGSAPKAEVTQPASKPAKAPPGKPEHNVAKPEDMVLHTEDLAQIKARGTLRILVQSNRESFLPRTGTPALRDVQMAEAFAAFLAVKPVFVVIENYGALIDALNEGKGDIIAAQLSVTKARKSKVDFSHSTFGVKEVLVGRKGQENLPKTIPELAGHTVHVRKSSSYAETLQTLKEKQKLETLIIAFVPEQEDAERIVFSVTNKERELTVVDSHILSAIETYNPDVVGLFALQEKREIAWAVRKSNPKLRTAVDNFILQEALTSHRAATFKGDLDGIRKNKTLRVLTRNNPVTYFLYRGRQFGFEYELAALMAKKLGVRLEMVVPPSRKDLVPWLLAGKGDVIAAALTVTEARSAKMAFSEPYLFANEVVVHKTGVEGPKTLQDLAGKKVHVRPSSSYYETLQALKKRGIAVEIVDAPEGQETEALIRKVAAGEIDYTISDDNLLNVEIAYGAKVEAGLVLKTPPEGAAGAKQIAFAVRPESPELKKWVDGFVKKTYRGLEYNIAKKRYFKNLRTIRSYRKNRLGSTGKISPYDDTIKRYSKRYGFDWRLMAAQAYVESHFDPKAKSWVGAKGLFQVMPRTGLSMGFTDLENPSVGTHAGIKYMRRLVDRLDPKIALKDRVRFALAAYNAGLGHVYDAQRLADQKGWDRNKWFGNVEKAMLLLADKKYARQARHGYCRGTEPVKYVSHIQTLYEAYIEVTEP